MDHIFPPKQEMFAKIVTNNIRCIEANSSASKRTGKFKSMHSGDKSESGAQYMSQTYSGLHEFLPLIKDATDEEILSELASYEGVPEDELLSEVKSSFGIEPDQLVQMFKLAINEMDSALI